MESKKKYFVVGISLSFFALIFWLFSGTSDKINIADVTLPEEEENIPPVNEEFGFVLDSFHVVEGTIKKNEVISSILLKNHVPWPEINRLEKKAKPIFSLRKLKSGKPYTILCKNDSTEKAEVFIYQQDAVNYIIFDLRDTVSIKLEKKPTRMIQREVAGIIHSSLYQTLMDIKCSPALAMEMSEIYAWTIDFYRIQKGDKFKVVFEEEYVGDTRVGVGKIKAAVFEHYGEPFYAFPFEQNGVEDYFDENAKSLRKAFLKSPLKFGRISSSFSNRRFHPVQKRWKAHLGTDYAAPRGTPILAVGDGVVIAAHYKKFNGNYVKIKHNSTYTTQYLHMNGFAKGIKKGKFVRQGQVIGYVGSTGLATGPHVCFRFWKNGKQVNHRKEKLPPSLPVKKELLESFKAKKEELKRLLDAIPFGKEEVSLASVK